MKKQLLALSLVAMSGLMAQDRPNMERTQEQNGCCNSCCSTPCCCKPCCTPKPKKCIDCECYVPAFYDLQCDWGFFVDVEFLYWYGKETNNAYGATAAFYTDDAVPILSVEPRATITNTLEVGADWDPGVRVGIGWNTDCDGWDVYLSWTGYWNRSKDTTNIGPINAFPEPGDIGLVARFFASPILGSVLEARWKLDFNQIDFEIGRKYWLSRCFAMRPYAGVRGVWTDVKYDVDGAFTQFDPQPTSVIAASSEIRTKEENWRVGLLAGFQPTWYFSSCFALYANFSAALVWGDQKSKWDNIVLIETNITTLEQLIIDPPPFKSSVSTMSSMIDLALGIRWEDTWCCDRYRTAFDLGWEHHIWFNHGVFVNSSNDLLPTGASTPPVAFQVPGEFISEFKDLVYGGLVVRLRFDF